MSFQSLEEKLTGLAEACQELVELLRTERRAMREWQMELLINIAARKTELLSTIRDMDAAFQAELNRMSSQMGCNGEQVLKHPEATQLRALRDRVREANQLVRAESRITHRAAEIHLDVIRQLTGAGIPDAPTGYGPHQHTESGRRFHQVC